MLVQVLPGKTVVPQVLRLPERAEYYAQDRYNQLWDHAMAAAKALDCYDAIYWIAGGEFKEENLDAIRPSLARMRGAYLIGRAAAQFESLIGGQVLTRQCQDLESALAEAHSDAQAAASDVAVVLLSPACASFDQFENFEARGDAFRAQVQTLEGGAP